MGLLVEPKEIKSQISILKNQWKSEGGEINWDNLALWFGNKIQKYLWDNWKDDLKKKGFTWQKFLRLMKYRNDDLLLWIDNRISWNDFVGKIRESLDGNLGDMIVRR